MRVMVVDTGRVAAIRAYAVERRGAARAELGSEAITACWDALARAALELDPYADHGVRLVRRGKHLIVAVDHDGRVLGTAVRETRRAGDWLGWLVTLTGESEGDGAVYLTVAAAWAALAARAGGA